MLAHVVRQAEAPDRNQAPDAGLVDLLERAVHLQVVAHAESGDVLGVLPVVEQLLGRLGRSEPAPRTQQCRQYFLHDRFLSSLGTRQINSAFTDSTRAIGKCAVNLPSP